jgi:hypothetical protein
MNAKTENEALTTAATPEVRNGTHDLHVKAVPETVWVRARYNALQSGVSFREYMIRLLEASQPILSTDR